MKLVNGQKSNSFYDSKCIRLGCSIVSLAMMLLLSSGCEQAVHSSQTIDLQPNDIRTMVVPAAGSEREINVTAESESEFSIHIHLVGDEQAVDTAVTLGKSSEKILAQGVKTTSANLVATIPAGKEAAVRFQSIGNNSADVTYTISN